MNYFNDQAQVMSVFPGELLEVMAIPIIMVVVTAVMGVIISMGVRSRRHGNKLEYELALEAYRREPTDPTLRQVALLKGRAYSLTTETGYGRRYFDEAALRNDLDLAGLGTQAHLGNGSKLPVEKLPIASRLQQLDDLYSQGVITEEEHLQRRHEILQEI